jgi:hypothetical protein
VGGGEGGHAQILTFFRIFSQKMKKTPKKFGVYENIYISLYCQK